MSQATVMTILTRSQPSPPKITIPKHQISLDFGAIVWPLRPLFFTLFASFSLPPLPSPPFLASSPPLLRITYHNQVFPYSISVMDIILPWGIVGGIVSLCFSVVLPVCSIRGVHSTSMNASSRIRVASVLDISLWVKPQLSFGELR